MTDLLSSSQFWLLISIGFYALGVEIQKKTGSPVCNPLLIASIPPTRPMRNPAS